MFRLPDGERRVPRRLVTIGLVTGVLSAVALGVGSASYAAARVTVPCSTAGLIAAINTANSGGGATIELAHHCTYMLTSPNNAGPTGTNGLPIVTSRIVVDGEDATIAGNNTNFRIFQVDAPNGALTLDHLTLTGGVAHGSGPGPGGAGGALFNNEATVSIDHSVITGNTADAGGGLASGTGRPGPVGSLTVDHSVVSNNVSAQGGGGILNHAGTLTVSHSRVTGNLAPGGGGIATGPGNGNTEGGSLTVIDHSQIDHNTVNGGELGGGGGIANGGTVHITHSEITDNTAPGGAGAGLLNHGTLATLDHSQVSGNTAPTDAGGTPGFGGGIANANFGIPGAPAPELRLSYTDVTHNMASGDGGGIWNVGFGAPAGTVTLDKSHVDQNSPDNCSPIGTIAGCKG